MTTRAGFRGLPPTVSVRPSPRRVALTELDLHDWWRQAIAEAGGDITTAVISVLRERTDDPLLVVALDELQRMRRGR